MTLKGSYAGTDALDPNARDVELHPTVLTGDLADDDIPVGDPWSPFGEYPSRIDNSFCVVTADIADCNVVLDGIAVTRANMYRPRRGPFLERAGGLYVGRYTDVVVRNCVFAENLTPGMQVVAATELTVVDCTFRDNICRDGGGGGIHIRAGANTTRVTGCTFERNHAREGAGLYSWSDSNLQVEDCVFRDNATPWGPTGYGMGPYVSGSVGGGLHSYGPGELVRCEFQGNSAGAGGAANLESDWTIRDCAFRANRSYESGGALLLQGARTAFSGCTFANNTSSLGGAVHNRGNVAGFATCLFVGNTAFQGGAIGAEDTQWFLARPGRVHLRFGLALSNCTVADNLSDEGGAIWCSGLSSADDSEANTLILSDCILDNGGDEIRQSGRVQISIAYTNLRGGRDTVVDPCESVVWGPGNIDVDPLFADPGYWNLNDTPDDPNDDFFVKGDYHLKSQAGRWDPNSETWVVDDVTSPCIDAGHPKVPTMYEPVPNGGIINVGVYGGTAEASKSYLPDIGSDDTVGAHPLAD